MIQALLCPISPDSMITDRAYAKRWSGGRWLGAETHQPMGSPIVNELLGGGGQLSTSHQALLLRLPPRQRNAR